MTSHTRELLLDTISDPVFLYCVISESLEQCFEGGEAVLGRCTLEPVGQHLSEAGNGPFRRGLYRVQ